MVSITVEVQTCPRDPLNEEPGGCTSGTNAVNGGQVCGEDIDVGIPQSLYWTSRTTLEFDLNSTVGFFH